ncbi:MAG: hypothetical protein IK012_01075 [Fibrobacter sp.]|uniref:hypothetical protein n=1 Tax=Fibrobacter sp. TaxID=35828 RepID=UPI0025C5E08A|nr:hypothetical protein [Fibrobacter sp.]MBR4783833.1 hypothetical protein [Fibrobacter sp.]
MANSLRQTWEQYHKGKPLEEGEVLTIDKKNGYILLERKQEEYLTKIEMCYWNESDKKHKLFAVSITSFVNGKYSAGQYDGLSFYRYNNASKTMSLTHDVGFDVAIGTSDGAQISYSLPRTGKDIIATMWYENKTKKKTIRWKGRKFN